MFRWFIWFGIGFALFVVAGVAGTDPKHRFDGVVLLTGIALWGWLITTFFAVPIGIILWLVRGRRRNVASDI